MLRTFICKYFASFGSIYNHSAVIIQVDPGLYLIGICEYHRSSWRVSYSLFTSGTLHTMSAKSLGTLAMIYATDELQNPLPLKTMLCEGDMNNPVRRSDAFLYN